MVGDSPVVVGVVMHTDNSGINIVTNIRTVHARRNFAKNLTDESILYLNEDKKRTRKWFHDCGISNVPLAGTKFGLIRTIAYTAEKVKQNSPDDLPLSIGGAPDGMGQVEVTDEGKYAYPQSDDALYTDSNIYSYDFLTHQEPLKLISLPDISTIEARGNREQFRENVQRAGMNNAKEHGTVDGDFAYVQNRYSGRTLRISKETIIHSLDGNWARMNDNGRFGAVIGEVVQNAIPINALKTTKNQVYGTYAMAAYAKDPQRDYIAIITVEQRDNSIKDIKLVDVAHSVSVRATKKSEASAADQVLGYDSEETERNPHAHAFSDKISIAEFLQIVKQTHQGILSEDVRAAIGGKRIPGSTWGDSALFSIGGALDGMGQVEVTDENGAYDGDEDALPLSIASLPDGRKYVQADRQVIFGNDPEEWANQIELYIYQKIRNGEDVPVTAENGDVLLITKDTQGKASFRNHIQEGNRWRVLTDEEYEAKLNAEAHIDELASVSRPDKNGKIDIDADSRHGDFASNGWKYRTAFFKDFDGAYYEVRISTAIGEDGKVRIYNVGKMKNRAFPNLVGSSDLSDGARWGNDSVRSMIPQAETEVKQNSPDDLPLSIGGAPDGMGQVEVTDEGKYAYPQSDDALYTDSNIYSYDFLTHQPDMHAVSLPTYDEVKTLTRSEVAEKGLENVSAVGKVLETDNNGKIGYVENRYTNHILQITGNTIRHGLNRSGGALILNEQLGMRIGEIARNAIPINGLTNIATEVEGTYAMAGYAYDSKGNRYVAILTVEYYTDKIIDAAVLDVGHSVNGRIENSGSPSHMSRTRSEELFLDTPADAIKIADFLDIVNSTHRSVLSEDVLRHFGETRPAGGVYSDSALFSIGGSSPTAQSPEENGAAPSVSFADSSPIASQQGSQEARYPHPEELSEKMETEAENGSTTVTT